MALVDTSRGMAPRPGFADPAGDSQAAFRRILDAMSRPGRIVALDPVRTAPPPFGPAMAAAALTLLDHETPVWLDAAAATPEAVAFLGFHCGCPLAPPAAAAFALIADPPAMPALSVFAAGSELYPDRAATLVLEVAGLAGEGGEGARLTLAGPGIEHRSVLCVAGLPGGFAAAWAANHARYPLGVDLLLACGDRLAGLPRSIRLEA